MLEIGLFHNGASSLPVITDKDGITFNKGSLVDVHRAAQETLVNQVRQGILAEKLGFQSFWLTEHHFQPEGAEMSPNPLMVQMSARQQIRDAGGLGRRAGHDRPRGADAAFAGDRNARRGFCDDVAGSGPCAAVISS